MQHTTKYPATFREFCNMAEERGITATRLLEVLGPIPMPPAGYTLAKGSDRRWIGQELVSRRWIITPSWDGTTNAHSVEVWMADHKRPTYANLSPADAIQLAADLTAVAQAIATAKAAEV